MSCSQHTTTTVLPADNAAVIAHINLLQGIINRLANNSASCKTWCLTLVGAFVSLAGATHVPGIIHFALVPVIIFGFVDAMYLSQERAYRQLYTRVITKIRTGNYQYQDVFEARAPLRISSIVSTFSSWSIFPIYLGLIGVYVLAYFKGWFYVLTLTTASK